MTPLRFLVDKRFEHQVLALMLVCLHLALWWDFGGALSRCLILAHLGLFLMWQPLWRREQRLNWPSSIVFILATLAFIIWLDWGLMTFWLLLLTGFVGGRVTARRGSRYAYLLALVFLVSEILIACVPAIIDVPTLGSAAWRILGYSLLAIPIGLLFVPDPKEADDNQLSVDFLYGLTVALLTCILAMGSLLGMYITGADYPVAVIQTILAIALFLLAISWLWTPMAGFSGLGQLWERYLQNVGTPFELWLGRLAELAQGRQTPEEFLDSAMAQLVELPWVAGVAWNDKESRGQRGEMRPALFHFADRDLHITVYSYRPVGTALRLHGHLLLRLVGHFFSAKQREQELTRSTHLKAVYETGARITHDIKNLLQSLHTITAAVQSSNDANGAEVQRFMEKQLPHLSQRLQLALDKLQAPRSEQVLEGRSSDWWESLQARNTGNGIRFEEDLASNPLIPVDLFDSVAENLLENARSKRLSEPTLHILVRLETSDGGARLRISDDGSPIDTAIARNLFKSPVASRNGLGIGLYQAARYARERGYELILTANAAEDVAFELKPA
jgi:hypothetical protein